MGIRVVKSFANEHLEEEKFEKGNKKFLGIKRASYMGMGGFQSTTRLFDCIMYIIVVVVGGLFLVNGKIDASDYIAYLMFVTTLLTSIRKLVEFSEQFQRGISGIERFAEIMDIEPEIADSKNALTLENVKGRVEFSNVTFSYGENGKNVLSNLNLVVNEGESIALVGPSGGGKTTLCSLIPRFYEVTSGQITIDGTDQISFM